MTEKHRETLQSALRQLPVYQAPEGIWEAVSAELDAAPPLPAPRRRWPAFAAAASLLLALGLSFYAWGPQRLERLPAPAIGERSARGDVLAGQPEAAVYVGQLVGDELRIWKCYGSLPAEARPPGIGAAMDSLRRLRDLTLRLAAEEADSPAFREAESNYRNQILRLRGLICAPAPGLTR
jgi:hypothetical protein